MEVTQFLFTFYSVPSDDQGWLCPACDCKVDCIELINDQLGTDISVEDEWVVRMHFIFIFYFFHNKSRVAFISCTFGCVSQKVFPEVASLVSSEGGHDNLELPSEDSEDHDYNPNDNEAKNFEMDEGSNEESMSNESDFSATSSEDLQTSKHEVHNENLGLPSDDSEDQDYDPDHPEIDQSSPKDLLETDESDFSSDTDDLDDPSNKVSDDNEVSTPALTKHSRPSIGDSELGKETVEPVSGKRLRESLDYKKLYDVSSVYIFR